MKKKDKPEISYDHQRETFLRNNKFIDQTTALSHWWNVDSDWTIGAYNKMIEITSLKHPQL